MQSTMRHAAIACAIVLSAWPAASGAYQETTVSNGGVLEGTVRYVGTFPGAPIIIAEGAAAVACGDTLVDGSLLVGSTKGIRNAVVTIEGITSGKRIQTPAEPNITARECAFVPRVQVVPTGTRLDVRNDDSSLHNVHALLEGSETIFNIALPIRDLQVKKDLRKTGLVHVVNEAGYPWMKGFVLVSDHPYCAVTAENGGFSMDNVPPGSYTVSVWHETLGSLSKSVTIAPNSPNTVVFEFTGGGPPVAPAGDDEGG